MDMAIRWERKSKWCQRSACGRYTVVKNEPYVPGAAPTTYAAFAEPIAGDAPGSDGKSIGRALKLGAASPEDCFNACEAHLKARTPAWQKVH
jgi:hypothetical protein